MSFLSKRFTAPALTVLAVAAVPLVAPMTADAALGGAKPLTSTTKPSLRSATIITPPNVGATSIARVCFDKPVSIGNQSEFRAGIYRTDTGEMGATADPTIQATGTVNSSPECIDTSFNKASLNPYTYISAGIGAVFNAGNANVDDSTTLIGASTQNGTTGRTTGPDLTGLSPGPSSSPGTIRFAFDQNLAAPVGTVLALATATKFHLNESDGSVAFASAATVVSPSVVQAQFTLAEVADAVRGYVEEDTLQAEDLNDPNTLISLPLPGRGGSTLRPDLQTVSVTSDGGSVDYRFDQNIKAPAGGFVADTFFVTLSDGRRIAAAPSNVVLNGDTVRATIPGGSTKNEYIVNAYVKDGAVTATVPNAGANPATGTSTAGGLDAGDNKGALAQGFTTGAEALSVTFNAAAGTASILLDQRAPGTLLGQFRLLDAAGNAIATNASSVSGNTSATAQRVTAVVSFPPADVAKAAAIQLLPNAFTTSIGAGNPVQVLAP